MDHPEEFKDRLRARTGIDPDKNLVLATRYTPSAREFTQHIDLEGLAFERRELFDAYQRAQGHYRPGKRDSLERATYLASFLYRPNKMAVFGGLYRVRQPCAFLDDRRFWESPENVELRQYGVVGPEKGKLSYWFDLVFLGRASLSVGRPVIRWPEPPIVWKRWLGDNQFPIHADEARPDPASA
jgi:hypothetical protein